MSESALERDPGQGDTSPPAAPVNRNPVSPTLLLLFLLLLGSAVTAVYLPSLPGPFALDDINNIVENPTIRMDRLDSDSFLRTMSAAENAHGGRPAASISFALNYFFGGYDPLGYRLFNLVTLLLSLPFAWWLIYQICREEYDERSSILLAAGVAVLWGLHPLLTNGVSYIVQRMTSMCALFSLAALCFFLKGLSGRRRSWYAISLLSWTLALASKEIAVLLPLIAAAILWLRQPSGSAGRRLLGWGVAIAALVSQSAILFFFRSDHWWAFRPFTLTERLLTEGRVVLRYLTLFLAPLPSRLNLDYDFPLSTSFFSPPATAAAFIVHAILIAAALLLRRRRPLFSFGLLSFYLLQLLESTVIPLEIIFEHRAYLPSLFLSLALADLVYWCFQRLNLKRPGLATLIVTVVIAGGWGSMTYQRNKVWASALSLAEDVVAKSPSKPRARHNMGVILAQEGEYAAAAPHLTEALRLEPGKAGFHNTMGSVLVELGRLEEAARHFSEALRLRSNYAEACNNLGNTYYLMGDGIRAGRHYRRAKQLKAPYPEADYNMGTLLAGEGKLAAAIALYEEALRSRPAYVEAQYNLGVALARQGKIAEAADSFRETIRLDPDHSSAHYNLGVALAQQGKIAEAADSFRETIRLDPDHGSARHNLDTLRLPAEK